jgi:hypothetical protein
MVLTIPNRRTEYFCVRYLSLNCCLQITFNPTFMSQTSSQRRPQDYSICMVKKIKKDKLYFKAVCLKIILSNWKLNFPQKNSLNSSEGYNDFFSPSTSKHRGGVHS